MKLTTRELSETASYAMELPGVDGNFRAAPAWRIRSYFLEKCWSNVGNEKQEQVWRRVHAGPFSFHEPRSVSNLCSRKWRWKSKDGKRWGDGVEYKDGGRGLDVMQISSGWKANESTCERERTAARMRERTCIYTRINVIKQTQWGVCAGENSKSSSFFFFLRRKQKGARATRRKKLWN